MNAPSPDSHASPPPDGDLAWFDAIVRDHRLRLLSLARRTGLDAEASLDCVQEACQTFLRLPDAHALASRPDDAARLLTTVTFNAARTLRRRLRALGERSGGAGEMDDFRAPDSMADEHVARREARESLARCMATLAERQRAVVTLRMIDDLPGSEVGAALGITAEHVAVLLQRAKAQLKGCMASAGHCDECAHGDRTNCCR